MDYLWPDREQWNLLRDYPEQTAKVVMLNLLRYRAEADYSDYPGETPCSGREAYQRYAKQALPCVKAVGGRILHIGRMAEPVIGPMDEIWDEILLVEYPNISGFLEMTLSEQYRAIAHHRTAALQDSRLIPSFSA